tara:strand:- start:1188 stop:1382 length:195 start_codon:yes stop_codon:yes gene_type:complete
MSRAIIKLLPNSSHRGKYKLNKLSNWFHKIVDYVDDAEFNKDFREYKSIEHIKDTWHYRGFHDF